MGLETEMEIPDFPSRPTFYDEEEEDGMNQLGLPEEEEEEEEEEDNNEEMEEEYGGNVILEEHETEADTEIEDQALYDYIASFVQRHLPHLDPNETYRYVLIGGMTRTVVVVNKIKTTAIFLSRNISSWESSKKLKAIPRTVEDEGTPSTSASARNSLHQQFTMTSSLRKIRERNVALGRAKFNKFQRWYSRWSRENVTEEDEDTCRNWMLGRNISGMDAMIPGISAICSTIDPEDKPPYRLFYKYCVSAFNFFH